MEMTLVRSHEILALNDRSGNDDEVFVIDRDPGGPEFSEQLRGPIGDLRADGNDPK